MKHQYYYKHSKVNGKLYMQIWKKENKKKIYVRSLGSAEELNKRLVRHDQAQEQTKEKGKIKTKNPVADAQKGTNLGTLH